MIYIVHGENLVFSRNFILNLQKKINRTAKKEVHILDTTHTQLMEMCASLDMFGGSPFVVLDITGAGRMRFNDYIDVMVDMPEDTVLVILSSKTLKGTHSLVKNVPNIKAKLVTGKKPKTSDIFRFVDKVFEGDRGVSYKELRSLIIAACDPFYVFSMLLYGLRNIAYAKFNSPSYNRLLPFVKSKLKKQAENFSEDTVIDIFEIFYCLDKDAKIGAVPQDLLVPLAVEAVLTYT